MGTYFQNVALVMGPNSEISKAHIYPTPYRSYPPPSLTLRLNSLEVMMVYNFFKNFLGFLEKNEDALILTILRIQETSNVRIIAK